MLLVRNEIFLSRIFDWLVLEKLFNPVRIVVVIPDMVIVAEHLTMIAKAKNSLKKLQKHQIQRGTATI